MKIADFIEYFKEYLEIDGVQLYSSTEFRKLNEWGSMSILSLIALADSEFGVELDAEDIKEASTIQDLFNIISSKL